MTILRAISSCIFVLGCGPDTTDTTDTSTDNTGDEQVVADAEDVPWANMNREQRLAFMQQTVTPVMQTLFQEFDEDAFADFGCPTCHGADMEQVDFAMPNGIAPLDPTQLGVIFASEEPMAQFMSQRVWPRMTELLQAQPYNPETHEGFGCLGCHATATPADTAE